MRFHQREEFSELGVVLFAFPVVHFLQVDHRDQILLAEVHLRNEVLELALHGAEGGKEVVAAHPESVGTGALDVLCVAIVLQGRSFAGLDVDKFDGVALPLPHLAPVDLVLMVGHIDAVHMPNGRMRLPGRWRRIHLSVEPLGNGVSVGIGQNDAQHHNE